MNVYINFNLSDHPTGGGNQFLKALSGLLRTRGLLTESLADADVVLINNYHQYEIFDRPSREFDGKAFVHRVPGLAKRQSHPWDQRDHVTKVINRCFIDGTIFQSAWARQAWAKDGMGGAGDQVVICNAPDPAIFYPHGRSAIDPGRKVKIIASAWSANWGKGFAVYQWLDQHLDFSKYEFTFVGNAPLKFKHIHMIAPVASLQLADLYRSSDIYVTAVRHEPCSNALLEALHCGLPAIAYEDGGNPEIVQGGGLLFRSAKEIPALLERIAADYSYYQKAITVPSLEEVGERYVDFFQKVLNKRSRQRTCSFNEEHKQKLKTAASRSQFMDRLIYWSRKSPGEALKKLFRKPLPHEVLFRQLKKGDIAIDWGANVGSVAARMAAKGATVYAFEPNPHAFDVLQRRFVAQPQVTCRQQAVWIKEGSIKLFLHKNSAEDEVYWSTGSSIFDAKGNVDRHKFVDVPMIDGARFIAGLGRVKLLKVDIEGAECDVINALIDQGLHTSIETILVETHDHKMPELKKPTDLLRQRIRDLEINNIYLDWV